MEVALQKEWEKLRLEPIIFISSFYGKSEAFQTWAFKRGGLCRNVYPWDLFPFSTSLTFPLNHISFQIPEIHSLVPCFGNLLFWRKIICLSGVLYISGLDQFSVSSSLIKSLLIHKRKISLLISSLVHPRSNYISPKMRCVTLIFRGDNQDLPKAAFSFYCCVFIFAPFRTVAPGITVLRNHWFVFHIHPPD